MQNEQLAERGPSLPGPSLPDPSLVRRWRDGLVLRLCARALRGIERGELRLTLPSGRSALLGPGGAPRADLQLMSYDMVWKSLRRGTLGFAEAYLADTVRTRDLTALLAFFVDNRERLTKAGRGAFKVRRADRSYHASRANTREGSRANISAHYDLGNAFYARWLDPSMTYSSALWRTGDESLEEAQQQKYAAVIQALGLSPGQDVLEIGCGWGGFAQAAARSGARVTGVTVSAEQLAYAQERLAAAGLSEAAELRFQDYRDITGTFDAIASIEMIEAVGEEHWPQYFGTLANRLRPGGAAVVQAITIRDQSYPHYRATPDFIQRYIFPGGMLPTVSIMAGQARDAGLGFEVVHRFGRDYARTLRLWRQAFEAAWPQIEPLGFDERFRRMWVYYLTYCEVGFDRHVIDVGLYRMTKPA